MYTVKNIRIGVKKMFTMSDIEIMTLPYFKVVRKSDAMFELQSRCTRHFWAVVPIARNRNQTYYKLLHKYKKSDNYHSQADFGTVLDAVLEIINHDDFKLNRKNGYFEEVAARFS